VRFPLIAVTAALVLVSIVALGGFAVAGPIAHNTLIPLITRGPGTSTYSTWRGRRME